MCSRRILLCLSSSKCPTVVWSFGKSPSKLPNGQKQRRFVWNTIERCHVEWLPVFSPANGLPLSPFGKQGVHRVPKVPKLSCFNIFPYISPLWESVQTSRSRPFESEFPSGEMFLGTNCWNPNPNPVYGLGGIGRVEESPPGPPNAWQIGPPQPLGGHSTDHLPGKMFFSPKPQTAAAKDFSIVSMALAQARRMSGSGHMVSTVWVSVLFCWLGKLRVWFSLRFSLWVEFFINLAKPKSINCCTILASEQVRFAQFHPSVLRCLLLLN